MSSIYQGNKMQDKLRTFCPIVLFHEHSYKNGNVEECIVIARDNDYHAQYILSHKERVDKMMQENSRYWLTISENAREYEKSLYDREQMISRSFINIPLANSIYTYSSYPQDPSIDAALTPKPKRRRGNLPKATTALLKDWLALHKKHPYPTEEEKLCLAKQTTLSLQQISNWFINARRRHLPHLLETDFSANGGGSSQKTPNNELDIYPYEAVSGNSTDSDHGGMKRHPCTRVKNGAIKKPLRGRRKSSF